MIDEIKASLVARRHFTLDLVTWDMDALRWCVSEIERLREENHNWADEWERMLPESRKQAAEIERLSATNQEIGIERDEALEALRRLLGQRCETCEHWQFDGTLCAVGGPSWLYAECANGSSVVIWTIRDGGAGCDNYERRER